MFSKACVILFTGGGMHGWGHAWLGCAWLGACIGLGGCVAGGMHNWGNAWPGYGWRTYVAGGMQG